MGQHYAPATDVTGRPAYPGLFLFKMLLVGIWHGGLSDEAVEDMANANLYVMRFLALVSGRRCSRSFSAVSFQNTLNSYPGMG
ncbi:transposase [Nitrosomonas cryotolerans]|uniref:transposase n=1 Tax=Nitrosomonas cryotolerans TaxID=44575 RepID=UPI0034E95223